MKRHFLSLLLMLTTFSATSFAQDQEGKFFITIPESEQQLTKDTVGQVLKYIPNILPGSSLTIIEDECDMAGVHHYYARQTEDGAAYANVGVRIHIKDNKLLAISGQVFTSGNSSSARPINQSRRMTAANALSAAGFQVKTDQAKLVITKIGNELRAVYAVNVNFTRYYVDAYTGAVVKEEPLLRQYDDKSGIDTQGKAGTYYLGEQDIVSALQSDGNYVLHDNARHIYTYNASWQYMNVDSILKLKLKKISFLPDYYKACREFTNKTQDWRGYTFGVGLNSFSIYGKNLPARACSAKMKIYRPMPGHEVVDEVPMTFDCPNDSTLYLSGASPLTLSPDTFYAASLMFFNQNRKQIYSYTNNLTVNSLMVPLNNGANSEFYQNNTTTGDQPVLDIHYGMERVIDFYNDVFNRSSFDNCGTNLRLYYNPSNRIESTMPANACAVPGYADGIMMFGTGYPILYPVVKLEVMGHEFTHLVARHLTYLGEPGALNEGFADIMGNAIYKYATGEDMYCIGKDLYVGGSPECIRDFANPEAMGYPSKYYGENWISGDPMKTKDYGGVHINSTVLTHWYYLLCTGGDDEVTSIGRDAATKIAFYALIGYQFPYFEYYDARKATVCEAQLLYGADSDIVKSVKAAWDAVNVLEKDAGDDPVITGVKAVAANTSSTGRQYTTAGTPAPNGYHGVVVSKNSKVMK